MSWVRNVTWKVVLRSKSFFWKKTKPRIKKCILHSVLVFFIRNHVLTDCNTIHWTPCIFIHISIVRFRILLLQVLMIRCQVGCTLMQLNMTFCVYRATHISWLCYVFTFYRSRFRWTFKINALNRVKYDVARVFCIKKYGIPYSWC